MIEKCEWRCFEGLYFVGIYWVNRCMLMIKYLKIVVIMIKELCCYWYCICFEVSDVELVLFICKVFSICFVRSEFFWVYGICGKVVGIRKFNFYWFFFFDNVCVVNLCENIRVMYLNVKLIFLIKKLLVL